MSHVEQIHSAEPDGGDGLIAIIVRRNYPGVEGIKFFTEASNPQQVAHLFRKAGAVVDPHTHLERVRTVRKTQEVLLVKHGLVKVNFYTSAGAYVEHKLLHDGDVCILLGGGHGLEFMEDTMMWEVKQGPYEGKESDKRAI
jgi:hypothetical protein